MRTALLTIVCLVGASAAGAQDLTTRPRPSLDEASQPAEWVAFQSTVERDGVAVGRFWRDRHGSTRLEMEAPDAHGRTIVLENIPQATYYVFRPSSGWTAQPMVLPTAPWRPQPMLRLEAGAAGEEAGLPIYERVHGALRERRAPALNFFPLVRQRLADGRVERHRSMVVGEVAASLFEPPGGVAVTWLATPGGIVALPQPKGGGQ